MGILYEYAVKVICGKADGEILAPGRYWTAINVHNPANEGVRFRKKVAIAFPSEKPGPVSEFYDAKLGPDEAFEIDCRDIREHAHYDEDFLKGFVVIQSETELDVVAVYTAAGGQDTVETLHIERVPPRRIKIGLPDLVPVPDENGSFCRRRDGDLIVTVKNQGSFGAGPSMTTVDFGSFGAITMPTPALAAGASVDLAFPIPLGCFSPDCFFRITVDSTNVVVESDEGNNTASGFCLG